MKRSMKICALVRRTCWIASSYLALLFDMKAPRRIANILGLALCVLFLLLGQTVEPELVIHKIGYAILTIVLDLPWVMTIAAFGFLCEIECSEHEAVKEVNDGYKR